jgi:Arc/MetJ family transcription regulator
MRTNIEINDELMNEAMRYANVNTKKAVVEEALRTFVEVKEKEIRIANYRERLKELTNKLAGLRLRQSPAELLRQDRDNR